MIGKLKGILSEISNNSGLIETKSGVFYHVFLTPGLLSDFKVGGPIELYTYLQVREDALTLYGFKSKDDHTFFTLLLSVPGVGPKTAYTVISYAKTNQLVQAIKDNDIGFFGTIKGLGRKTGMKIILELSQKLKQDFQLEKMYLSEDDKLVIDALVSLGYSTAEAHNILPKLDKKARVEERIKQALKIVK